MRPLSTRIAFALTVACTKIAFAQSLPSTAPATSPSVNPRIAALIHDLGIEGKQQAAFDELFRIGPEAIPAAIQTGKAVGDINDREAIRRYTTASILIARFGPRGVPEIVAFMRGPEPQLGASAFGLLRGDGKDAVGPLVEMLKLPEAEHRWAAAQALGAVGRFAPAQAVPALVLLLHDPDDYTASQAANALGDIGPGAKAAIPELIASLNNEHNLIRADAARAIGKIADDPKPIIPVLVPLLRDKDSFVRDAASSSLGNFGPAAASAVPDMIVRLRNKEENYPGSNDLGNIGASVIGPLIGLLKDADPGIRQAAIGTLSQCAVEAEPATPAIIALLTDPIVEVRASAARAIGRIGPGEKTALDPLGKLLKDPAPTVRDGAICSLGLIGADAAKMVPAIVAGMDDPNAQVRQDAVRALGNIHAHPEIAVPALIRAGDRYRQLSSSAAHAIAGFGPGGASAIPALLGWLNDSPDSKYDRSSALYALGRIGTASDPRILPVVIKSLDDKNLYMRAVALGALISIDPPPKDAISHLISVLGNEEDDPFWNQGYAAFMLGLYGKEASSAIAALEKASHSFDELLSGQAAAALCRIRGDDAGAMRIMAAQVAASDRDDLLRQGIPLGLLCKAYPHSPLTLATLIQALQNRAPMTRNTAAFILGDMGHEAKSAMPAVQACANDRSPSVRHAAIVALRKLTASP